MNILEPVLPRPVAPNSTAGALHIAPKCTVQCSPQHRRGNGDLIAGGGGEYYFSRLVYCFIIYFPPAICLQMVGCTERSLITNYIASTVQ